MTEIHGRVLNKVNRNVVRRALQEEIEIQERDSESGPNSLKSYDIRIKIFGGA